MGKHKRRVCALVKRLEYRLCATHSVHSKPEILYSLYNIESIYNIDRKFTRLRADFYPVIGRF